MGQLPNSPDIPSSSIDMSTNVEKKNISTSSEQKSTTTSKSTLSTSCTPPPNSNSSNVSLSVTTSDKDDDSMANSHMPSRIMSSSSTSPISFFHTLPQSLIKDVPEDDSDIPESSKNEVILHDVIVAEDIDIEARLFSDSSSPAVIKRMCQSLVPGWSVMKAESDIKVSQIMAGLTNQLFKVELRKNLKANDNESNMRNALIDNMSISVVLFRIYGKDVSDLYDTNFEVSVFQALSNVGIAPKLVERFPGGRIEEWILGPALLTRDMCKPPILCAVAAILGRFHKLSESCPEIASLSTDGCASVWKMMDRWKTNALRIYESAKCSVKELYSSDENAQKTFAEKRSESNMSTLTALTYKRAGTLTNLKGQTASAKLKFLAQLEECGLYEMEAEAENLKRLILNEKYVVPDASTDICFCHNDVQENNILVTSSSLRLIDFEYADFNYPAYDISNFLWETTCDYCHPEFPFYTLKDPILGYPSDEVIKLFGAVYLSERHGDMILPSADQLDGFVENVKRFLLGTHLVWGFWSVIRANQAPTVNEFDFLGYAKDRFDGYRKWKKHLSSLELFTPKDQRSKK